MILIGGYKGGGGYKKEAGEEGDGSRREGVK